MTNTIKQSWKKYFLAGALLFAAGSAPLMAQSNLRNTSAQLEEDAKNNKSIQPAAPGTYQILAKDAQSHEVFPIDILLDIEKNRDQKKVVYMKAGKSSVIKILPYREINSKKFVPVPEYGVQK